MSDQVEYPSRWCTPLNGAPSAQSGPLAVQHPHTAVPVGCLTQVTVSVLAAGGAWYQRRGGGDELRGAGGSSSPGVRLARRIGAYVPDQIIRIQRGASWRPCAFSDFPGVGQDPVVYFDCPKAAGDAGQVDRVGDFFVPEEFCPRAVRTVGQVLTRAFARAVPSRRRLVRCLPEERKPGVSMPEADHGAPAPVNAEASRATAAPESLSISKCEPITAAGLWPSSADRGRENHRRMPNSL